MSDIEKELRMREIFFEHEDADNSGYLDKIELMRALNYIDKDYLLYDFEYSNYNVPLNLTLILNILFKSVNLSQH